MDCQFAQATLDAGRPDRSDWAAPELRAAADHVQSCTHCQTVLSQRGQWDARVAAELAEIELPRGLQDRMLAALHAADRTATAHPAAASSPARPRSRRAWAGGLMAAGLLLAVGWGLWPRAGVAVPLDEVFTQVLVALPADDGAATVSALLPFDGTFDARPQDALWAETVAGVAPQGLEVDGRPGQDAAAYRFAQRRVSGWLIVLPRARVANPPVDALPTHANSHYGPRPHVAWSTPTQVCVCVLDRGTLDDLRREFYGTAA